VRQTTNLLMHETPVFITSAMWPPSSPEVYQNIVDLKPRVMDACAKTQQINNRWCTSLHVFGKYHIL